MGVSPGYPLGASASGVVSTATNYLAQMPGVAALLSPAMHRIQDGIHGISEE